MLVRWWRDRVSSPSWLCPLGRLCLSPLFTGGSDISNRMRFWTFLWLQNESKGATKRAPHTRGTATSFGFRRRPSSGIPMPVGAASYGNDEAGTTMHQRSKSAGPEQERRRDEESCHQRFHSSSSGRSTPRLAPPKKEAASAANGLRTNRFGFRQPQQRYTNKVGDICSSHSASHYNQEKLNHHHQQQQQQQPQQVFQQHRDIHQESYAIGRPSGRPPHERQSYATTPSSKLRPSPVNNPPIYAHQPPTTLESDRRASGIPEPISKYTLHTSHLPLPQFAVRMNEANTKVAKTVANQCRKVSTASKGSTSSKEGSGTEDSGLGSQQGYPVEHDIVRDGGCDYRDSGNAALRRNHGRPRNLRMVLSGKSFDVRDVEDDSTVTEISVIPLPKSFASGANLNTGFVRDRTVQYQRVLNKDNRYTDSTTSMSTTSSEGYDEGLGEEKVYKDRSHNEKLASIKSDFSPPSSDDPEYGHGEAMADEYSLSSSDECRGNNNPRQHLKTISNAAKTGTLPKCTLRSVLLTIEDPAFAAAAATTTSLIDDETSPVDSLVDSLTASITQSDGKNSRKECLMERSGCTLEDESPGTPTNASNSLSLSEGREFFDDEIADQPGLTFDDTLRNAADTQSTINASHPVTENSHTLVESAPKSSEFLLFFFVQISTIFATVNSVLSNHLSFLFRPTAGTQCGKQPASYSTNQPCRKCRHTLTLRIHHFGWSHARLWMQRGSFIRRIKQTVRILSRPHPSNSTSSLKWNEMLFFHVFTFLSNWNR